ncbi:MAG: hypothetical protein PHQ73_07675 [Gallionella sp.]|nr:hypothetical protein [Gallionella sp.]
MKNLKLMMSIVLLCFSQFVFAAATPAQLTALENALAAVALDPANQSLANAAVQAAANADIAENDIVTRLFNLGVLPDVIRAAMSNNINIGTDVSGVQQSCSPLCGPDHLADVSYKLTANPIVENTLGQLAATGAGGGTGGGTGGSMPATGSGPNGAVTPG